MRLFETIRDFLRDERGVGTVFMICTLPAFLAIAGFAIDGAAAYGTRTILQTAADASALAAAQDLPQGANVAVQTAITYAQKNLPVANNGNVLSSGDVATGNWDTTTRVFTANGAPLNAVMVTMRRSAANGNALPTSLLGLIGVRTWDIQVQSIVTTSSAKLRVSLALDNSGSMCDPDPHPCPGDTNPSIKIIALKTATNDLLTKLKAAASNPKDVTVAIVPFTNAADVGTTNKGATWLTYAPWDQVGTGYGSYTYSYKNSKGQTCKQGSKGCNQIATWVPTNSSHSTWTGCVMDRDQNYDAQNTVPVSGSTLFPAAPAALNGTSWNLDSSTCPSKMIGATDVLDSTGWTNLTSTVSAMQAGGATNQTIGLDWGWMLMTKGSPIVDPGDLPTGTQPVLILLSDGLNTQDRWYGDGANQSASVDTRMALACTNAKTAGVTIYTVYVDLGGKTGNSAILQNCATDKTKYFDLTTSNQIVTAFNQIGNQITKLKVVQ